MPLRNLPAEVAENIRNWIRGAVRFAGAGLGGFMLLLAGTAFLVEYLNWEEPAAYAVMLVLVTAMNFVIQQKFVFVSRDISGSTGWQAAKFLSSTILFRGFEWSLFSVLVTYAGFHYTLVAGFTTMTSFFGKYVVYDKWVFKKR